MRREDTTPLITPLHTWAAVWEYAHVLFHGHGGAGVQLSLQHLPLVRRAVPGDAGDGDVVGNVRALVQVRRCTQNRSKTTTATSPPPPQ
jgi:hypothetical protein